jgi:sterol 3beta-glucosyltransferase
MEAVKESGVRALVSAGWGGLGGADVPPEVFILKGTQLLQPPPGNIS